MNRNYVKHSEVNHNRVKVHGHLGMTFYFTEKEKVEIDMDDYVERIINALPMKIGKISNYLTPDENNIFEKGNSQSMGLKETE